MIRVMVYSEMESDELMIEAERCVEKAREIANEQGLNEGEYQRACEEAELWIEEARIITEVLNKRHWWPDNSLPGWYYDETREG